MNINKIIICDKDCRRLDKFLTDVCEGFSRSKIQNLIREGRIRVDGAVLKASAEIRTGQKIEMKLPEDRPLEIEAKAIPLDIVYEDKDIIIVNKPQDMVVHPAYGHYDDTLVNALLNHCHDLSGINGEMRPGIVHRIDKDTSGLLVAAKNDAAHKALQEQWQAHKRIYKALVCGDVQEDAGTVEAAIGRSVNNRLKMAVDAENGRPAVTHYRVLERFNNYTLLECELETGRTHQIRVHMAYIGHPLAGDALYGRRKDALGRKGQYLHAAVLGIKHPSTGEYMEFTSELPEYFQQTLEKLHKGEI